MKNIMLFFAALFVAGLFFTTQAYSASCGFQLEGRNTRSIPMKFDVHIRKYQGTAAGTIAAEPGAWVKLKTLSIDGGDEFTETITTTLCDSNANINETSRYEIKLTLRNNGSSSAVGYNYTLHKHVLTTRFITPKFDNSSVKYVGDLLYYIYSDEAEDHMQ